MTAIITLSDYRRSEAREARPAEPFSLLSLFGMGTMGCPLVRDAAKEEPQASPEEPPELKRATLLQSHLRHVHEMIEHLGPAAAVELCRTGLEAAELALTKE